MPWPSAHPGPVARFEASRPGARVVLVAVALGSLLASATPPAAGAEGWILTEVARNGAVTPLGESATLADCLTEQKSREETQRAYLRAANESDPRDQLPLPVASVTHRCLPDSGDRGGRKGR